MESFKTRPNAGKQQNRKGSTGIISIVNAKANTKRLSIKKVVLDKLGYQEGDEIQFRYDGREGYLAIAVYPAFGEHRDGFEFSNIKKAAILYNAALVKEITEIFQLDFTNRTSLTFGKARYSKVKKTGMPCVRIYLRGAVEEVGGAVHE